MNKKAWIRVVEVFIAIILIIGVIAFVITERYVFEKNGSTEIKEKQNYILKKIQLNHSLRETIIGLDVPVSSEDGSFPEIISLMIDSEFPSEIGCYSKICAIDSPCLAKELEEEAKISIYSQAVSVFSTKNSYSPKQVKIFCWK